MVYAYNPNTETDSTDGDAYNVRSSVGRATGAVAAAAAKMWMKKS